MWKCNQCGEHNPDYADVCSKCNLEKGTPAISKQSSDKKEDDIKSWTCSRCGIIIDGTFCWKCGAVKENDSPDKSDEGKERKKIKKCPFCAEEIQYDAIRCRHCGNDLTLKPAKIKIEEKKEEMTICLYCKESIKKEAIKCPHCGENLFYQRHPFIPLGIIAGGLIGWFIAYSNGVHIFGNNVFDINALMTVVIYIFVGGITGSIIAEIKDKIKISSSVFVTILLVTVAVVLFFIYVVYPIITK